MPVTWQRPDFVDHVLTEQAAVRVRVLDDRLYRVEVGEVRATFRLQLFGGAGLRPVAVAIQDMAEGGTSLTNACEDIAGQVWRDHFPLEPQPPLWVQRTITSTYQGRDTERLSSWQMFTFATGPQQRLTTVEWSFLTQSELDSLVGQPVDEDRGTQTFLAESPQDRLDIDYTLVSMHAMPQEKPFRESCMATTPGIRSQRWFGKRTVRPQRSPNVRADCCWYHSGDWSAVINAAVRLIAHAKETGLGQDDELRHAVIDAARAAGVDGWKYEALYSLLIDPIVLVETDNGQITFVNGQHRTRAMRDAGVPAVLVMDRRPADTGSVRSDTGEH